MTRFNRVIPLAIAAAFAIAANAGATDYTAGTYQIDLMHSKVGFEVPHLVISSVDGRFNEYEGELVLNEKLENSKLSVSINVNSIDTAIAKRDEHLRGTDFFDTAKFPKITFKSKKVTGSTNAMKIAGDLTIKGVTKEVTLEAKYLGSAKDGYGNLKIAFEAETKISRKAFGLTWNQLIEAGPAIGDEVAIKIKVQGAKVEPKKAAI
jgi:polyisoprenoid-binding protein YceI